MKVLSIGNSFSQDAQRYLSRLAKHNGEELLTVNLMIGGCPLEKHYDCMINDKREYMLGVNGVESGVWVSMPQVVMSSKWDVITLQQASHFSFDYSTYQPYANKIVEFVKEHNPEAKILIQETWAYADVSDRLKEMTNFSSAEEMHDAIKVCYDKMAKDLNADGIIPSGTAMQNALKLGMEKVHRDGFHASLGAGRYMIALCWYKKLFDKDISADTFNDFDEPVSDKEREIVIKAVNCAFSEN